MMVADPIARDGNEATPDDLRLAVLMQMISVAGIVVAASLAPVIERMMSDPDIEYKITWQIARLRRAVKRAIQDLDLAVSVAIGLSQIRAYLRKANGA